MHRCPTSKCVLFLSTPSARRATGIIIGCPEGQEISIHALREEGDPVGKLAALLAGISIHALREEGDVRWSGSRIRCTISIHALREEGDEHCSTGKPAKPNFYPRPPRGGRPVYKPAGSVAFAISIHALREEGDSGLTGV